MKIPTTEKISTNPKSKTDKTSSKKVIDEKDGRDLKNSLTDWNAEQNQSGRHK